MLFYRIPRPDEAMLISGRNAGKDGAPFKVVTGHGAFVFPLFRRAALLSLAMQEAEVHETCFSKHGIEVHLDAVMAFKVGTTNEQIVNAGQRFIQNQNKMVDRAGKIFAGHLRSIAGSMSVEEMIQERQKLADQVLSASKSEMEKLGLIVDSFQIEKLGGIDSYIAALAAPHNSEVKKNARVAQANADRDAAEVERAAEAKKADFERQANTTKAGYTAQVAQAQAEAETKSQTAQAQSEAAIAEANADRDRRKRVAEAKASEEAGTAQAKAEQAGPLAKAMAEHDVAVATTTLAEQQALQREQELKRDVIAPAKANAEKRIAEAKADSEATELQAAALASSNRVQVDMELVKQLPQVAQAIASELNGANVTFLNGADGLGETVTGLVAQAKLIFDTMKTVRSALPDSSDNGVGELEAVGTTTRRER
jgi:regulator of protease activity HflC (stomatin/prohibitin superfamily)